MQRKEIIRELESEEKVLVEKLGNVRMALRGLSAQRVDAVAPFVVAEKVRKRVYMTAEMRKQYVNEIKAVLLAYGPSTVSQLAERGEFGEISHTSIYRLALEHQDTESTVQGRTLVFSLKQD